MESTNPNLWSTIMEYKMLAKKDIQLMKYFVDVIRKQGALVRLMITLYMPTKNKVLDNLP